VSFLPAVVSLLACFPERRTVWRLLPNALVPHVVGRCIHSPSSPFVPLTLGLGRNKFLSFMLLWILFWSPTDVAPAFSFPPPISRICFKDYGPAYLQSHFPWLWVAKEILLFVVLACHYSSLNNHYLLVLFCWFYCHDLRFSHNHIRLGGGPTKR